MREINTVAIIGMGALGMLFGERLQDSPEEARLCFLMDEARKKRHLKNGCVINGREVKFPVATTEELSFTPDLIMIATKEDGLRDARAIAERVAGEETLVLSLLNGITSEAFLRETLGEDAVIDCVAIGMDAVRDGNTLNYSNMGRLQIGTAKESGREALKTIAAFFDKTQIPYEISENIAKTMWNKFMLNVGANQTCMVHNTTYGGATKEGSDAFNDMVAAMREVIAVAQAEGVDLTEDDLQAVLKILRGLNPDGLPSMQQDALAGRKSEVNLFAGTLLEIASRHGIAAPVNERYMARIREMEKDLAPTEPFVVYSAKTSSPQAFSSSTV